MKPVRTPWTNSLYKLEGGTDENDLPIEKTHDADEHPVLVSTWEVSPQEAQEIVKGKRIQVIIWGEEHPPIAVILEGDADESDAKA